MKASIEMKIHHFIFILSFGIFYPPCQAEEAVQGISKITKLTAYYQKNEKKLNVVKTLEQLKKIKPHSKIPKDLEAQIQKIENEVNQLQLILKSQ